MYTFDITKLGLSIAAGDSLLVITSSLNGYLLVDSITRMYSSVFVDISAEPIEGAYKYVFSVGNVDHAKVVKKRYPVHIAIPESDFFAPAESARTLIQSDWRATRDIERQLLAMHEAGIWQLPDDVRQRMLDREQMRVDVDREIQESSL